MTAERIRCLRICGVHLMQADFAAQLDRSTETVKDWERNRGMKQPRGESLIKLAKMARKADWNPDKCTGICK